MKKFLLTFAAAACCAMSATMFTACGSDNDGGSTPGGGGSTVTDTVPAYVAASVTFRETEEILKYCDVLVKYNDGTGEKTDTLKTTVWTKTLSSKLPSSIIFKKIINLRDSAGLVAADTIKFNAGYSYTYTFYNAAKQNTGFSKTFNVMKNPSTLSPSKKANFIAAIKAGRLNVTVDCTYDAKGNWVDTSEDSTAVKE